MFCSSVFWSSAKTILDGVKKVLQGKKQDYQNVRETVKNIDPCAAEFGIPVKDMIINGYRPSIEKNKNPHTTTIQTQAVRELEDNAGYTGQTALVQEQYNNNNGTGTPVAINIVGNQEMGKQMILDRSKDEGMSK